MNLFIAWDGDHIGREVGRASMADDADGLRRISQAIDSGNDLFKKWVLSTGGSIVSAGGDEGRAEVPVSRLSDIPRLRHEYKTMVGASVSVGVGVKLSEADRALVAAKLQGGDRVQLYTHEVDQLIQEKSKPQTEAQKLSEAYGLNKTAPGLNEGGQHAGMQGAIRPSGAAKPTPSQGDHEEGQVAQEYAEENAPEAPEMTHAAKDLASQFHDLASEQSAKDQQTVASGTSRDAAKQQVVKILTEMRGQTQVLDQLKQAAPQAYKAVVDSVQAMLAMAKELGDGPQPAGPTPAQPEESEDTQKSEPGMNKDLETARKMAHRLSSLAERKPTRKTHELAMGCHERLASFLAEGGYKALADEHKEKAQKHRELAAEIKKDAEDLDKGPMHLPMPHVTMHPHLNLPAGSTRDGKVKVVHGNGAVGWKEVRAGQVMSQDGHSVSARNPNGS